MLKSKKFFLFTIIFFFNILNLNANEKITYLNIDFVIQNSNIGKSILKNLNNLEEENKKKFLEREKELRQIENDLIIKKYFI